jgi:phospholipase/carboxylesterase
MTARFSSESLEIGQSCASRAESACEAIAHELVPEKSCEVLPERPVNAVAEVFVSTADADDVYVPENYEPNYAYPLIVWLSPSTGGANPLRQLMPVISDRNYFGVALPYVDPAEIDETLPALFASLRRTYRLHTERVYLAGVGAAGTHALVAGLSQPDRYGGIVALSARWPDAPQLLRRFGELRGKRVLIGVDAGESASVIADALYAQQLLWSAGMHVSAVASPVGPDSRRSLLREIDRWIMQAIGQPELVC